MHFPVPNPEQLDTLPKGYEYGVPRTYRNGIHEGIDLGGPAVKPRGREGDPVWAAAGGRVRVASWLSSGGNAVYITHNDNLETRYYHLAKIMVKVGQTVSAGQQIGTVGKTGTSSTPAHLHFEVRTGPKGKNSVNPRSYISAGLGIVGLAIAAGLGWYAWKRWF